MSSRTCVLCANPCRDRCAQCVDCHRCFHSECIFGAVGAAQSVAGWTSRDAAFDCRLLALFNVYLRRCSVCALLSEWRCETTEHRTVVRDCQDSLLLFFVQELLHAITLLLPSPALRFSVANGGCWQTLHLCPSTNSFTSSGIFEARLACLPVPPFKQTPPPDILSLMETGTVKSAPSDIRTLWRRSSGPLTTDQLTESTLDRLVDSLPVTSTTRVLVGLIRSRVGKRPPSRCPTQANEESVESARELTADVLFYVHKQVNNSALY
ncbi:MAG: hypothetical protein KVP17_003736 [Porospora cf. gigantea B]|uniref:uncharacterized protein n=2 Tax=Porospora cf. gigantea B TaxID=2853592 RepID=UPI003571E3AA|nr:MAG: hypothetical protein KVP17_003736 [Porospora cf. gigantea B]